MIKWQYILQLNFLILSNQETMKKQIKISRIHIKLLVTWSNHNPQSILKPLPISLFLYDIIPLLINKLLIIIFVLFCFYLKNIIVLCCPYYIYFRCFI
jgi:hypothetical protein